MSDSGSTSSVQNAVPATVEAVERPPFEMVPAPAIGRIFTGERRVRLGDVDPQGRLRFDALTRYTQDVSNDDTRDAGLTDDLAFVVRTTTVDVHQAGVFGEDLTISTFCGRLGKRWAERRLSVVGSLGACYEVATLWVHIDTESGRPLALSDDFLHHYGAAAMGRTVSAKQTVPKPALVDGPKSGRRWPLRAVDFDTFAHMNNAAYWAVVEEDLRSNPVPVPSRTTIEYGAGIGPDDEVIVVSTSAGGERYLWWEVNQQPAASAVVSPLQPLAG